MSVVGERHRNDRRNAKTVALEYSCTATGSYVLCIIEVAVYEYVNIQLYSYRVLPVEETSNLGIPTARVLFFEFLV